MAKVLARFSIAPRGDDYLLQIESDDGVRLEVTATFEQLDLLAEAIEEQLDSDEDEELEVEEGGGIQ